jgi:hypothetical protein
LAFLLVFPPKPDCPLAVLFMFAEDRDAKPFDAVFVRPAALKKRCEAAGALRKDAGFAARPDGLKLSRDGEIGILPLTMLACRNEASLIGCPRPDTAARPKRLESIETNPARTRSLRNASLTFEKERSPRGPIGPKPSWTLLMLVTLKVLNRPPQRPHHGWYQSPGPQGSHPMWPNPKPKPKPTPQPPPPHPKKET